MKCPNISLRHIRRFLSIFNFKNCMCSSTCCHVEIENHDEHNITIHNKRKRSNSAPPRINDTDN